MTRVAVLDDFQRVAEGLADWSSLGDDVEVVFFAEHFDPAVLTEVLADFDIVVAMRERSAFPRETLERLPKLRLLATTGMANAAIDLEAAAELGIVVSGTAGSQQCTLEMTWALILGVVKHLTVEDRSVRAGTWQQGLAGDLAGKTLGLIGLGRLGSAMVPVARVFKMDVIAWSMNLSVAHAKELGVAPVSKDELLSSSDVISIHLRLSERTTGIIAGPEFAKMKPTAYLVNTSRGPIVDETALVDALRRRMIAGAAVDVYDTEPLPAGHRLSTLDNIVLTPHLGYASESNVSVYFEETLENISAFIAGSPLRVLTSSVGQTPLR